MEWTFIADDEIGRMYAENPQVDWSNGDDHFCDKVIEALENALTDLNDDSIAEFGKGVVIVEDHTLKLSVSDDDGSVGKLPFFP